VADCTSLLKKRTVVPQVQILPIPPKKNRGDMQQGFRWNIGKREQLGDLMQSLEPLDCAWQEAFFRTVAKVLVASQNHDLVFVGRSLENMFDFLSGVFNGTPQVAWCSLLSVSLRIDPKNQRSSEFQQRLRQALQGVGLTPQALMKNKTGIALVDVVASGYTFGLLTETLLKWAVEENFDPKMILQKLRFVGVLWQKHTSPKTWRWQQHSAWVKQYGVRSIQNVSLEWAIWNELANMDTKVTPANKLQSDHLEINRQEKHLMALSRARQLYELGTSKAGRQKLASCLSQSDGLKQANVRRLILDLRG
jgi:hypothetical protein